MYRVPATHAKAAVSAIVSGLIATGTALITALQGENTGFDTITMSQWITVVVAGLAGLGLTGGATARTTNAPPAPTGAQPQILRGDSVPSG
jgi:hypothetical protein